MTVEIATGLLASLQAEAERSPGAEICGLLFGTQRRIHAAKRCANVAVDRRSAFEIDPVTLLAVHKASRSGGQMLIGYYHSHPTGSVNPSVTDRAAAMGDGMLWLILGQDGHSLSVSTGPGKLIPVALACTVD